MLGASSCALDAQRGHIYVLYATIDRGSGIVRIRAEIYDRGLKRTSALLLDRGLGTAPHVTVDSAGAVWITQIEQPPPPFTNFLGVERFSPALTASTTKFFGPAPPVFHGVDVVGDPRGGVVIAGNLDVRGVQNQYRRANLDGIGPTLTLPGILNGAMAIDSTGHLYVEGNEQGTGLPVVIKLDDNNTPVWSPPHLVLAANRFVTALSAMVPGRLDVFGTQFGPSPGTERVFVSQYGAPTSSCTISALGPSAPAGTITKSLLLGARVMCGSTAKEGAAIRFSTTSAHPGAMLSSTFTLTNSTGIAFSTITFGVMTGTYTVTATCDECTPNSVAIDAQARLFMAVEVSTPIIKPVPFNNQVGSDQTMEVRVRLFGVGGSTDVVAGYPLVLASTPLAGSGGHDHDANRPRGSLSGTGLAQHPDGLSGMSDSSGTLTSIFISTYFAGVEMLVARSTIDANFVPASSTVTIRIGDFVLLPNATFYVKDGGTCRHFGPEGPPGCVAPDRNHYGTAATTTSIAAIAARWLDFAGAELMLEVNDISLEFGGGFDVGGNWTSDIIDKSPGDSKSCNPVGHCEHRNGAAADFQVNSNSSPGNLTTKQKTKLDQIIRANGGTHIHVEGSHWHVRF